MAFLGLFLVALVPGTLLGLSLRYLVLNDNVLPMNGSVD